MAGEMRIYGLTGGIGSGKSEAARRFEALGLPVIDADRIGHEAIEPGGAAERGVIEAFGEGILTGGRIDRKKLAERVFGDLAALDRLNRLTHPAVAQEIARRTADLADAGHQVAIIEAALHAEDGKLAEWLSGLVLITCPEQTRIERLVRDRGMSPVEARARIASQTPPETKAPLAKWIIRNDGDFDRLQKQVERVAREL
jgi:dephospho-CoA kinase